MRGTFTLPNGHKVRNQSTRRYVLVGFRQWGKDPNARWFIWSRSDSRDTILAKWRSATRSTSDPLHVIDTSNGEVVR